MLLIALLAGFLLLLVLMVVWPKYLSALTSLACMVGAALVLIYIQEKGAPAWFGQPPAQTAPPRLPPQPQR